MKNSDQVKQWGAAEDDFLAPEIGVVESFLGSPFSTHEEDEVEKRDEMTAARNQYIADVSRKAMAGVIDGLSPATDPFSNEEEDEAFAAIEKKQGCSVCGGQNKQLENEKLRSQIQSLRDYCDRLLAGELSR